MDDELFNQNPVSEEYPNEAQDVASLHECFERRYNACPEFFIGSLKEACKTAFNSTIITERRPVLVYIHSDKDLLSKTFCSNIFCSEILIDYLGENYIVWSINITDKSNQYRFMWIWKKIFPNQLWDIYFVERCPMLIGIMRHSVGDPNWFLTAEYEFQLLLKGDQIMRTQEDVSGERVFNELAIFKKKFENNEQALSFDFSIKTDLNWDILLEISKYLSLNDIVNTFSTKILPFLYKYEGRLHLCEPSDGFMKMIVQEHRSEQIVSLRLKSVGFLPQIDLSSLTNFNNIMSLTLDNFINMEQINECTKYLPQLTNLSLWYDIEISFHFLGGVIYQLKSSIKRLKIRCAIISDVRYRIMKLYEEYKDDKTIKYFTFDIRDANHIIYFKERIIRLIKIMKNIEHVCIITNEHNFAVLLNSYKWNHLKYCKKLKKVTFQVAGSLLQDEEGIQHALKKIEKHLCSMEKIIEFQVTSL